MSTLNFEESGKQLEELQNKFRDFYKTRTERLIVWDRSGVFSHLEFYRESLRAIGHRVSIEHERADNIDADLYWIGDNGICVIDYKGKWIVDIEGFTNDLDSILEDPRNHYKIFSTRIKSLYRIHHLLSEKRVADFENSFYDTFDL